MNGEGDPCILSVTLKVYLVYLPHAFNNHTVIIWFVIKIFEPVLLGHIVQMKEEGGSWAVLVVTSVMSRVQQLASSREQIFCDSTSSCDASQSTVTFLLSATKAGGFPIAILIHDGQSKDSYCNAFKLLRESCPSCFGEENVSYVFQ